jgi:hypothetical protein
MIDNDVAGTVVEAFRADRFTVPRAAIERRGVRGRRLRVALAGVAAAVVVAAGGAWWLRPDSPVDGLPVDPAVPFDPAAAEAGCRARIMREPGWEQISNPKIRIADHRAALFVYMMDGEVRECLTVGPDPLNIGSLDHEAFVQNPPLLQEPIVYDPGTDLTLVYGFAPPDVEWLSVECEPAGPEVTLVRDDENYLAYLEGDLTDSRIRTTALTPTRRYTSVDGRPESAGPR